MKSIFIKNNEIFKIKGYSDFFIYKDNILYYNNETMSYKNWIKDDLSLNNIEFKDIRKEKDFSDYEKLLILYR